MTSLYRLGSIVHNLEDHNPRRKEWVRQCTVQARPSDPVP